MQYKFIDSHCHVHFQAYATDMDEVVQRNLAAGVGMITVGSQKTTSRTAVELAQRYEGVWASVGLHPNHLHAQTFYDDDELPPEEQATGKIKTRSEIFDPEDYRELVKDPNVIAIGEFGLDYYRIPDGHDRDRPPRWQKPRRQYASSSSSRGQKSELEISRLDSDFRGLSRADFLQCGGRLGAGLHPQVAGRRLR